MAKGRRANNKAKKGLYKLDFPNKYVGKTSDNGEVLYRSSWEQRVFYYMDHNKNVIEWSNETVVVPYLFKIDGKVHRYYPDVVCKAKSGEGIVTMMLEVKPKWQTVAPTKPKNRSISRKERYEKDMYTYVKNECKWEAAEAFCAKNGYIFKIITEDDIF